MKGLLVFHVLGKIFLAALNLLIFQLGLDHHERRCQVGAINSRFFQRRLAAAGWEAARRAVRAVRGGEVGDAGRVVC